MKSLGRILTAMVTPYGPDGTVDLAEAVRLAQFLIARGNDGLVLAGSTGEGNALDDEEKIALCAAVKRGLGADGIVIANTAGINTRHGIAMTQKAEAAGVDGILATVPAYVKPTQEGMLEHFGLIAEGNKKAADRDVLAALGMIKK